MTDEGAPPKAFSVIDVVDWYQRIEDEIRLKKLSTELKRTIPPPQVTRRRGLAVTGEEAIETANLELLSDLADAVERLRMAKIPKLFEHYGIATEDWKQLALCLAVNHVPGFQLTRGSRRGRKLKWDLTKLFRLVSEVARIKETNKLSTDREALIRLARKEEWRPDEGHRGTAAQWTETLESRLQDGIRARRSFVESLARMEATLARAKTAVMGPNSGNTDGL